MSVNTYRNGQLIRVAGIIDSEIVTNIQVAIMPVASLDEKDKIYQYVGATDTYVNGHFYKCVEDDSTDPATYSWVEIQTESDDIFTGTASEWSSLSLAEKQKYIQANIIE
jgi:hypothetical protein